MITRATFDEFLAQEALAVVGASRKKTKFGYKAFHDLRAKGYKVHPVNPNTGEVDGVKSYPNVAALPKGVGGLVLVVPPSQTERIVREAKAAGITRIWMQPGAESAEAVRFCEENGMTAISGICIMMQAVPVRSIHKIHRFFARLGGKIPK
jgi:hypothetical protein